MIKSWFITGTSSGFGRLLTEKLLCRGDRVAATLRQVNALDELKARHGESLWVATLDVTDTQAVRRVVDRAFDYLGRIDVVVNNAGYGLFGAAEEVSDDQIRSLAAFGRGLVSPPPLDVYEDTPAGEMRRALAAGTFTVKGDPVAMAEAMIDSVERRPAPRRLALGSSAYTSIRAALVDRLTALDAQREIALSTDEDA